MVRQEFTEPAFAKRSPQRALHQVDIRAAIPLDELRTRGQDRYVPADNCPVTKGKVCPAD